MGSLNLRLIDVYKAPLAEQADIFLENQTLSERFRLFEEHSPQNGLKIDKLRQGADGLYRILVEPISYQPVSQFIRVPDAGSTDLELQFPVDISRVVSVQFPDFSQLTQDVSEFLTRAAGKGNTPDTLYASFDDLSKAGLLNISTKASYTLLVDKSKIITYFNSLNEAHGDRIFVKIAPELVDLTTRSAKAGIFYAAPEVMHAPPAGFEHAGSFKTQDHYGNLQLTFHKKLNSDPPEFMADVDIDDAAGFEHFFQVIHNAVTGDPTHPYNIHEILVGFQEIDPGYKLITKPNKKLVKA